MSGSSTPEGRDRSSGAVPGAMAAVSSNGAAVSSNGRRAGSESSDDDVKVPRYLMSTLISDTTQSFPGIPLQLHFFLTTRNLIADVVFFVV